MSNIKGILQTLLANDLDFVLIGGLAATMYGASTVTYDVDICFSFTPENVQKLINALKDISPRVRAQTGWTPLSELPISQLSSLDNLYLQTDSGGLDILGSLREIGSFSEVKKRSESITLFGKPCLILNIESLIFIKENIARPKDLQVAIELRAILEKKTNKTS